MQPVHKTVLSRVDGAMHAKKTVPSGGSLYKVCCTTFVILLLHSQEMLAPCSALAEHSLTQAKAHKDDALRSGLSMYLYRRRTVVVEDSRALHPSP